MPNLDAALRNRRELLKGFPVNSIIEWKYAAGEMTVTGHDLTNGRVLAGGGSYNPVELTLKKKPDQGAQ